MAVGHKHLLGSNGRFFLFLSYKSATGTTYNHFALYTNTNGGLEKKNMGRETSEKGGEWRLYICISRTLSGYIEKSLSSYLIYVYKGFKDWCRAPVVTGTW